MMKFQLEKTWDTKRRLETWRDNQAKFDRNGNKHAGTAKTLYPQAAPSSVTSCDGDEYVLTEEEEAAAIEHARKRVEDHYRWHMADQGQTKPAIDAAIASIDWSKDPNINRDETLRRANSNKLQQLWHQRRREDERLEAKKKQEELVKTWTAKRLYRFMAWNSEVNHGRALIVNDDTLPLIRTLCYFLSADPRFETELGFSFKKGLMIRGTSGLGKTHLVRCVSDNELQPVKIVSMLEVADVVKSEGECLIATDKLLYLDDVGTETCPVKYYGTEINWFKDFLELYYSSGKPFARLLLSTNLSAADIESKYGYRVRSRMREMFNVLDIQGEDLRGQ
jgi:hypothetical protein